MSLDFPAFALSEEHEALRESVRSLADDKIAPRAAEVDRTSEFPWDVYEALVKADLAADLGVVVQCPVDDFGEARRDSRIALPDGNREFVEDDVPWVPAAGEVPGARTGEHAVQACGGGPDVNRRLGVPKLMTC